jgi:hypothetical protein
MKPVEAVISVILAIVATAVAMGSLHIPSSISGSSIMVALFLIIALAAFAYSPVVGIAAMAVFAVMIFSRNVEKTSHFVSESIMQKPTPIYGEEVYGDQNIYREPVVTQPYSTQSSEPRMYDNFRETYNVSWGPLREGFAGGAAYSEFAGSGESIEGQYPIDENRVHENPTKETYDYRPESNTGTNDFMRHGPDLDEKVASFQY